MAARGDVQVTFAVVMLSALVFLITLQQASAIKCYQCNSKHHPHCDDVKGNKIAAAAYIKECEDPDKPANATFFCRKTVLTVLNGMDDGEPGEKRIIRKCGYVKSPKPCYHFDDEDHAELVCQCFGEACNSAPALGAPSWRAALTALSCSALLLLLAR